LLFQNTIRTISNWKVEKRPIISLLEKYFSKEDLEEFLETGKIQKQEVLKRQNIAELELVLKERSSLCERLSEIIKLLAKYKTGYLALSLAKSLESNQIISGTSKRLHNTKLKLDFLKELDKILHDLSSERSDNVNNTFQSVINKFNDDIGFDFNEDDKSIVYHIITRYKVYNTLYDLDV
jgi:hypothetical protein